MFGEGGLYGDPPYFCFNSDVNIHTDINKSSHCGKGENNRDGNHENMIKTVSDSSKLCLPFANHIKRKEEQKQCLPFQIEHEPTWWRYL